MKHVLIIAMLLASTAAFAADGSVATPPAQQGAGNGQGPGNGEKFEEVKAKILAHLREKEACVQAASNREALKACMPHMGERRGEGGGNGNNGVGGGFGGGRWGNRGNGNNGTGAAPGNSGSAPGQQ